MSVLLRSAVWYLQNWKMNPLFNSIWKNPIHEEWSSLYMAEISPEDVIREYNNIVAKGKKPAGVALVPSKSSRVVILDIDKTEGIDVERVSKKLANSFVIAMTPRGGLRVAFRVKEGSFFPHRIVIKRFGEQIGEGGGSFKHPWTFPPSVACVKDEELPDGSRKCLEVRHYHFVLPDGRLVKYPWEIQFREPPEWDWNEAKDYLELELGVELVAPEVATAGGELKVGTPSGFVFIPIPCWRTLSDFLTWLETEARPPLPQCVAHALGYRVLGDERMIYTGQKVPHGLRFTLGAVAVMFLAACIATTNPEEIINFVGQNLEDFPADEGEPLNTKLSRLLVRVGNIVVPKYAGIGSLSANIPPELCKKCTYASRCMRGVAEAGGGTAHGESSIKRPWIAYSIYFYWTKIEEYKYKMQYLLGAGT